MRIIIICMAILFIMGCASQKPVEVRIPIPVKAPAPNIPSKPYLPIKSLKADSKPVDIAKAYVVTVKLLEKWGDALQKQLEGYR